uniref:Secreted protein n=1 Tax=Heterorhabditis bacteriophora TaxID=37862 RepID=A0A1I7XJF1_HETBA
MIFCGKNNMPIGSLIRLLISEFALFSLNNTKILCYHFETHCIVPAYSKVGGDIMVLLLLSYR